MNLKDALLSEFDQEIAATRRLLERVPDPALPWKPHEKSFSLGGLATHLAQLPHWGRSILEQPRHDLVEDESGYAAAETTTAGVLAMFDRYVADVRKTLDGMTDGELEAPWALTRGGQVMMWLPRASAFRRFFLYHLVHHRGQMSVYLRLQGVPLPPMYGPTADERM